MILYIFGGIALMLGLGALILACGVSKKLDRAMDNIFDGIDKFL